MGGRAAEIDIPPPHLFSVPVLDVPVFGHRLMVMAALAQSLPVLFVPEQVRVAAMRLDMIHYTRRRIAAICTNRMFLQKYFSVSLPTRIIATLSSTFTITIIAHEFFLLVLITITVCIIRQAKTAKLTAFTLYSVWQAVTSFHA